MYVGRDPLIGSGGDPFRKEINTPEDLYALSQEQLSADNLDEGIQNLITAAWMGHIEAADEVFRNYQDKVNDPDVEKKIMQHCILAAEEGDEQALCLAGYAYCQGWGVEKNLEESFRCHEWAASLGNAESQEQVGYCYMTGEGVELNRRRAFHYFNIAANQASQFDDTDALLGLGNHLLDLAKNTTGDECKQIEEKAFSLYQQAAYLGSVQAQYEMGYCYYYGHGVDQDYDEAFKNFMMAAEQGHVDAQYDVGSCYALGRGVNIDEDESLRYCHMAAIQGHTRALFQLANMYFEGYEIEKNLTESLKCYKLCLASDNFENLPIEDKQFVMDRLEAILAVQLDEENDLT